MAKKKPTQKKKPSSKQAMPEMFLQASLGHRIKRAGWEGKSVTGDGKGGFVLQDGSAYKPAAGDLEATDWVLA